METRGLGNLRLEGRSLCINNKWKTCKARPAIYTNLIGIIPIFYGNWVRFRFSEYLGNIPIFFRTKFSPPRLKTLFIFFLFLFLIRPTRSTENVHKRIDTENIIIIYRYCFFLLYIIKCEIEIDINISVVTTPNIDSAELFTLSFIHLCYHLSIFTSRLCCYFQRRIIPILSSKSTFF